MNVLQDYMVYEYVSALRKDTSRAVIWSAAS